MSCWVSVSFSLDTDSELIQTLKDHVSNMC